MKISVLTMMPGLFGDFLKGPVIERAARKGALEIQIIDINPNTFADTDSRTQKQHQDGDISGTCQLMILFLFWKHRGTNLSERLIKKGV